MADLISRAAAIAEIEEYIEEYSELEPETGYHNLKWCAMEEAKDVLSMLPAVDAVHVVRCRDCMYFRPWRHDRGEDSRCEFWNTEMGAEDYCSQAIYLNNGRNDDGKAD